jgi:uncharacterized membrane protein YhaH (DUF805 family)
MRALAGWTIIVAVFGLFSMALLWPAFALLRRVHGRFKGYYWVYSLSIAVCSLALWYLIPFAVFKLFGQAVR